MKILADLISELGCNEHVRAGKRLWHNKLLASHLSTAEMKRLLEEMEQQLPKSERLGLHFTDRKKSFPH